MTLHIKHPPSIEKIAEVWPILKEFMPRCRDCRWWTLPPEGRHLENGWRWCMRLTQGQPGYLAIADDEYGPIETSPDFGCVQFEIKESA